MTNPPSSTPKIPMGPNPTLLSHKQVDTLYSTLSSIQSALSTLQIPFILTGGSLLGAVRQHSILFCDDDIDLAIVGPHHLPTVRAHLPKLLGPQLFQYKVDAWEGSDRVRCKAVSNVFVDVFCLREYKSLEEFLQVVGWKKNGQKQEDGYVCGILDKMHSSVLYSLSNDKELQSSTTTSENKTQTDPSLASSSSSFIQYKHLFPCWQFTTRKAIELWPKEVYRPHELFPLEENYKFGPLQNIPGPRMPVLLLQRAFGKDCFEVYYPSCSHHDHNHGKQNQNQTQNENENQNEKNGGTEDVVVVGANGSRTAESNGTSQQPQPPPQPPLKPKVWAGGTWEASPKQPLQEEHYIPMQPMRRAQRRFTGHNKAKLFAYLEEQMAKEENWLRMHNEEEEREQEGLVVVKKNEDENEDKSESENITRASTPSTTETTASESTSTETQEEEEIEATAVVTAETSTASSEFPRKALAARTRPNKTIYMDGVFDLFHIGHLHAILQCVPLCNRLILGIPSDFDATSYKRPPIIPQADRVAIVESIRHVDQVICPCPLIVTEEFMKEYGIDVVVHGFASEDDFQRQYEFFEIPIQLGRFERIGYYDGESTTEIIKRVQALEPVECPKNEETLLETNEESGLQEGRIQNVQVKMQDQAQGQGQSQKTQSRTQVPLSQTQAQVQSQIQAQAQPPPTSTQTRQEPTSKWFGQALATATHYASTIPYDPFPIHLRAIIEPHIARARLQRSQALEKKTFLSTEAATRSTSCKLPRVLQMAEEEYAYNPIEYPLREALLQAGGMSQDTLLEKLHTIPRAKVQLLQTLTQHNHWQTLQHIYDEFVRETCAPRVAALYATAQGQTIRKMYYQAFPCIRVVQPGEFSIGPHADLAYGHDPCSINVYVPLTDIGGSKSLFLEGRPGSEDWHPIVGGYGMVKQFAGGSCLHWTAENTTEETRVSLDGRLVVKTEEEEEEEMEMDGGEREGFWKPGYYRVCTWNEEKRVWVRKVDKMESSDGKPDARVGFPWTVKDWDRYNAKQGKKKMGEERQRQNDSLPT